MQRLAAWLGASEPGEITMTKRNRERPATIAEMAEIEFDGSVSRLTAGQRAAAMADLLATISAVLPLAYELRLLGKDELVTRLDEQYDELGLRLMELAHASDAAKLVHELLESAEARLAVALSVVEGAEDGEDATQH
jgi:Putative bacterial toxin ydaT